MRLLAVLMAVCAARGEQRLLSAAEWNALRNEISGDRAWHWTNRIAEFDRNIGSDGYLDALRYVEKELRGIGITDTRVVELPYSQPSWTGLSGELWIREPVERKIGSWADAGTAIAINSRSADVTAEIFDAGAGDQESDYAGKNVAGKIVLAGGRLDTVYRLAVFRHGAAGVITYAQRWPGPVFDFPDHIGWQTIPWRGDNGREPTWAFSVSLRTADELRETIRARGRVTAHVRIETRMVTPGKMHILIGTLPGASVRDEAVVYTAHLDHMRGGANDDASGCANLLEIARALVTLTKQGKIRRPARDIQFWFAPEVVGEYAYFSKFPDERKKMLVNLNQEMVGEDQTKLGSAAIFERAPWSLPTYLNDALRHFVEHVIDTNVGTINQHERFSDPIFAALGSRDHFFSFLVPFYTSSDHEVFAFGPIGIPAVHVTCFPDYNLHTNRDTIYNVDATQLRRIALIVGATGYFVSAAGDGDVPALLNEVVAGSHGVLAKMSAIAGRRAADPDARGVIETTVRYLEACIRSTGHFARGNRRLVEAAAARFAAQSKWAVEQLADLGPAAAAPAISPDARMIPRYAVPLGEIIERRARARAPVPRVSNPLLFEIDSLIDGRRSVLDIYRVVVAESWFGGSPYYGPVTLDHVVDRVKGLAEAGSVRLEAGPR